jgi:hypothetical protein
MRSCPTLNNNITDNYRIELTMTEVAPYATDHDDDSKRIASSYSYDLPSQDNEDDNSITGEVSLILCTDIEIYHIGRTDAL